VNHSTLTLVQTPSGKWVPRFGFEDFYNGWNSFSTQFTENAKKATQDAIISTLHFSVTVTDAYDGLCNTTAEDVAKVINDTSKNVKDACEEANRRLKHAITDDIAWNVNKVVGDLQDAYVDVSNQILNGRNMQEPVKLEVICPSVPMEFASKISVIDSGLRLYKEIIGAKMSLAISESILPHVLATKFVISKQNYITHSIIYEKPIKRLCSVTSYTQNCILYEAPVLRHYSVSAFNQNTIVKETMLHPYAMKAIILPKLGERCKKFTLLFSLGLFLVYFIQVFGLYKVISIVIFISVFVFFDDLRLFFILNTQKCSSIRLGGR